MPDQIEVVHRSKDFSGGFATDDHSSEHGPDDAPPIIKRIREKKKALRQRKVLVGFAKSHSNRSAHIQVSHAEITHDEPSNVDVVDVDAQFAVPTNLFVTGVLQILLGVISLTISTVLYFANSIIEVYMEASGSHTHSPAFFVFISEVLTVIAGVGLITSILIDLKFFYRLYPHLLWIIVMFDFVAIGFSLGSWCYLNMNTYARMFESEAMVLCDGDYEYYNILWNRHPDSRDPEPRIWSKLETGLRCCGFNGIEDWVTVCNGKVPLSCCRQNSMKECQDKLTVWNLAVQNSSSQNTSSIRHLLYQKSCRNVLSLEANSIQRDWIIFSLIIGLFDLVLMINGNHKMREMVFKLQSAHGRKEMARFRHHCWNKLKCKRSKTSPEEADTDGVVNLSAIPDPNDLVDSDDIGFVTDRDSLQAQGLAKAKLLEEMNSNETSIVTVEDNPIRNLQPFEKDKLH